MSVRKPLALSGLGLGSRPLSHAIDRQFANEGEGNGRSGPRHCCSLSVCLWAHLFTSLVVAAADEVTIEAIQRDGGSAIAVGFGGQYKVGHWTPVRIRLKNGPQPCKGQLVLETRDGDGQSVRFVQEPAFSLQANEERLTVAYARFGTVDPQLVIRFQSESARALTARVYRGGSELSPPLLSTDQLVVVMGGTVPAVRSRVGGSSRGVIDDRPPVSADAAHMPDRWHGYEAVDTLVLLTDDLSSYDGVSEEQWSALDRWIQLGGRLVLSVGRNGASVFDGAHPLSRFNPGQLVEVRRQSDTSDLESIFASSEQLNAFEMTVIRAPRGAVEVAISQGNQLQPFWVRFARGMGQVDFVAADLGRSPWSSWSGRMSLISQLIGSSVAERRRKSSGLRVEKLAHVGYRDITGQLRGAMDQFRNVRVFPFGWVASLIGLYALLVGPGDFFFLRRWLGRQMHWSWLTFPLWVGLCCLLAFGLSRSRDEDRVVVNKVEIVDVDAETGWVRGTTWAHLYSPSNARYDLTLQPLMRSVNPANAEVLLCWQGLPGNGLGGLANPSPTGAADRTYQVSVGSNPDLAMIRGLPVQESSSKSLSARWSVRVATRSQTRLVADQRRFLSGQVHNPLEADLVDPIVLYQNTSYEIDQVLRSGQTVSLDRLRNRDLRWKLQQRVVVSNRDVSTYWDAESVHPSRLPRILELMMFYAAAGGESYVELTHRYQPYLDLTTALRTGRAILVGLCKQPLSDLRDREHSLAGEASEHWTFVRVIFPVDLQSE